MFKLWRKLCKTIKCKHYCIKDSGLLLAHVYFVVVALYWLQTLISHRSFYGIFFKITGVMAWSWLYPEIKSNSYNAAVIITAACEHPYSQSHSLIIIKPGNWVLLVINKCQRSCQDGCWVSRLAYDNRHYTDLRLLDFCGQSLHALVSV